MKLENIKIGRRLALAFGLMMVFLVVVSGVGLRALANTKGYIDVIVSENFQKIALANTMRHQLSTVAGTTRDYLLYNDKESHVAQRARIVEVRKETDVTTERMGKLVRSVRAKELFAEINEARAKTQPLIDTVLALVDEDKVDEARASLRASVQTSQEKWVTALDGMIARQVMQNDELVAQLNREYDGALRWTLGSLALAIVCGTLSALYITRSIVVPLNHAVDVARTVAGGDLTTEFAEETGSNETASLLRALARMNASLLSIVGQVRSGTDMIATASSEIASGNLDLSSRTEQQASSLEETASSMEEMTSTTRHNADNARQANELAVSAQQVAQKGGAVVAQVVGTMNEINDASKKIVEIISVIDGIAFQTNILALNAAVEAARAGEQGRGFAVVASEVRNLAQRSAAAAKDIKHLIGDSVDKVASGTALVGEAGLTMTEIVASIGRVTDIMSGITEASREQLAGIDQINQAISEMDTVTQQNAALVEEAAAAAASLQEQSGALAQVVSVFKLNAVVASGRARPASLRVAATAPAKAGQAAPAQRLATASKATANAAEWEEF
jgi:methyl-accepting chemotaxis protein